MRINSSALALALQGARSERVRPVRFSAWLMHPARILGRIAVMIPRRTVNVASGTFRKLKSSITVFLRFVLLKLTENKLEGTSSYAFV